MNSRHAKASVTNDYYLRYHTRTYCTVTDVNYRLEQRFVHQLSRLYLELRISAADVPARQSRRHCVAFSIPEFVNGHLSNRSELNLHSMHSEQNLRHYRSNNIACSLRRFMQGSIQCAVSYIFQDHICPCQWVCLCSGGVYVVDG